MRSLERPLAGSFDKLRMNPHPRFAVALLTQPPSQAFSKFLFD